ncbi:MAG: hypothetical protein RIF33_02790 [Cyclobacteriaceae bacterium]
MINQLEGEMLVSFKKRYGFQGHISLLDLKEINKMFPLAKGIFSLSDCVDNYYSLSDGHLRFCLKMPHERILVIECESNASNLGTIKHMAVRLVNELGSGQLKKAV